MWKVTEKSLIRSKCNIYTWCTNVHLKIKLKFDIKCTSKKLIHPVQSVINFVAVITETSTLSNIQITLEMAFFEKDGTLVNGELSLLKEIFTERDDTEHYE